MPKVIGKTIEKDFLINLESIGNKMKKYLYNLTYILSAICLIAFFTKWNTQGQKTYKAGELNKLLADGNEEKEHAKP
ncbi:MAG: hypothetical protein Q8933_16365, partial [Bacteroidota bacterium]|nr:hypothetical protein [Bacteroidota bacterium]